MLCAENTGSTFVKYLLLKEMLHMNQEQTPTSLTASTLALPSWISLITVSECPRLAA